MNPRIGDRFTLKNHNHIWEYTGINVKGILPHEAVCVKGGEGWEVGDIEYWHFADKFPWTFIGNFAKDNNFEQLYNLFNS